MTYLAAFNVQLQKYENPRGEAEGAGIVQPEEKAARGPYKCL